MTKYNKVVQSTTCCTTKCNKVQHSSVLKLLSPDSLVVTTNFTNGFTRQNTTTEVLLVIRSEDSWVWHEIAWSCFEWVLGPFNCNNWLVAPLLKCAKAYTWVVLSHWSGPSMWFLRVCKRTTLEAWLILLRRGCSSWGTQVLRAKDHQQKGL